MGWNILATISQLSSLSKIFEKTIFEQASEFLNSNNITHELQFGFRPNHSCSHAVLKTVCELEAAKNKNLFTILVSIDLRKAFVVMIHFEYSRVSNIFSSRVRVILETKKYARVVFE